MNPRAMASLVQAVLSESRTGGLIHAYLLEQAAWEGRMRQSFAELVADMRSGSSGSADHAAERLRFLNGAYRTRYAVESMQCATRVLIQLVGDRGWWQTNPPDLLGCSETDGRRLASLVPCVIDGIEQNGCKRPYSLLTKFLHFCFPDSFPIYDAQSASSIQMWAFGAFEDRGPDWRQFRWIDLTNASGRGYVSIIEFYRLFWSSADEKQRVELPEKADYLSRAIGGTVSTLDLIDKLLWIASGDPLPLGMRQVLL